MKNLKRALRRNQWEVKFKKRIKNWLITCKDKKEKESVTEQALKGECLTFLRTTGNPCNCAMCSYYKYVRQQKQYIQKEINEEISNL